MEKKKSKKADLENKRLIFFEFAVILVLLGTLTAFEWGTKTEASKLLEQISGEEVVEDEIINTFQDEKPPPPPPPKPQVIETFEIVEDDIEIDDIELEDMDTDIDEEIAVQTIEEEEEEEAEDEVFVVVENMPEFPGGMLALRKFLANNVEYPQIAIESGLTGRVIVGFVIDKQGKVTNVKILRGVDDILDKEAVKVVKKLPAFKPGSQRGKPVRVSFTVPVTFRLQN
jgi:protein TonB